MERDRKSMDEILKQHLPWPSQEATETNCNRVLDNLLSTGDLKQQNYAHSIFIPDSGRRWTGRLSAMAATVLVVLIVVTVDWRSRGTFAHAESGDGSLYRVVAGKDKAIAIGESLQAAETIRASAGAGGTLALADGSRVEMRARSELSLEDAGDGVRLRLSNGGVIVNAAKQRSGQHLYVQTKDITASVVGTVFLVSAEEQGSRVAVIEGEVRVRQNGTEKNLGPGEQAATKAVTWQPVSEEIVWSRSKETHLALLQQSTAAPTAGVEPRQAFEVVSVRPTANSVAAGERGGGGVRRRNPRPPEEPCGSEYSEPVIDPGRFDASNTTAAALFFWAYGVDCVLYRGSDRVFGSPDWFKSDGFDVLAVIPKGTPLYTREQLWAHDAPQLQGMLQTMLVERFQLAVHPETKEMPVYVLTAAKGGPRFIASRPAQRPAPVITASGRTVMPAGSAEPEPNGMSVWREGNDTCCQSVGPGLISGKKKSMAWLTKWVGRDTGRIVLDRSGLEGEFNFQFTFEPDRPMPPGFPVDTRSIFKAIEEDLGLKLEAKTEKVEVLVIDHVVRPSEN